MPSLSARLRGTNPPDVATTPQGWSAPDWVLQALTWAELDQWHMLSALGDTGDWEALAVAWLAEALVPPGRIREIVPWVERLIEHSVTPAAHQVRQYGVQLQTRLLPPVRAPPAPSPGPL